MLHKVSQCFSVGVALSPRRYLAVSGDIFDCYNLGRACYWHSVGRDQGGYYTSYHARSNPLTQNSPLQNVRSVAIEKLLVILEGGV